MAILDKCNECGRENGYAYFEDDTICARCTNAKMDKKKEKKDKGEEEE